MNKVAVIGLGNISKRHRANLRKLYPVAKIFAVSASGRQLNETIDNADEFFSSLDELLKHKIDMAIVASPATYHAQHVIPLLKAGIPVLIEKPISASNDDADAIIKVAIETKTPVAVAYCLRYLSSSKKIKELLNEDIIGVIYNVFVEIGQYLPDWRPSIDYKDTVSASKKLGGGALLELSHELDYLDWLFGELQPVSAILRSSDELDLNVEDLADILASSKSSVVTIHLDFLQKKVHRQCRIIGSKAILEWDLIKNQIIYIDQKESKMIFDGSQDDRNKMYLDMLTDFQAKIAEQVNACITVEEAFKTVSFINKVKKIAENN